MAILLKRESARLVDPTASLANRAQSAISACRDISGTERLVKIVESLTANHAIRPSSAASARKATILSIIPVLWPKTLHAKNAFLIVIPAAVMLPVKPAQPDIIKMPLKNVLFVQVSSQTASNVMPKSASSAKIAPYTLQLQANVNHAILVITTVPRADQPQTVLPASPTSISLVEYANYVARISQDASHAKPHQQRPPALAA
jgi:hypothetical protein